MRRGAVVRGRSCGNAESAPARPIRKYHGRGTTDAVKASEAEIEDFLRASQDQWFVVAESHGSRRGVYADLLRRAASQRGWILDDVEDQIASVIARNGGVARPQTYSTLSDALTARLLRWRRRRRVTSYYELPAAFFESPQ